MIIVLCRARELDQSWLIFEEGNGTPPVHWAAPPDVDQDLRSRLGEDLAGCFEAEWIDRKGNVVLSLGTRLPLPQEGRATASVT